MDKKKGTFLKNYAFSLILIASIMMGSVIGLIFKEKAVALKPLGDIFLNLLFTIVVPLVFFSISSAVAAMSDVRRLGKIIFWMLVIFLATSFASSFLMVAAVKIFPVAQGMKLQTLSTYHPQEINVPQQIVKALTVSDFNELFSKKNMLALILFSMFIGLAASMSGEKGKLFVQFLRAASSVMEKAMSFIMLYAPIGLGAYFAYLVGSFGPQLFGSYFKALVLYYPIAIGYFVVGFSFYAYLAGGFKAIKKFWANILPVAVTAWGTGSSIATIPVNLKAAEEIGAPKDIRELTIPIGATIHMDGSCLAAILKIAFLFGIFGMNFSGPQVILSAIGVAIVAGVVISGIPSGGMLGELMIVTLYGFPIEALPMITMIGTLVDPPATMLNATGDNVVSMLIARILNGKGWMNKTA
ncbi:MAG: dicarboxylate/amino acid:cation symporter [Candidatus Omnitrophica bacterium]|nr:dicarboxylate/amino acid:cation symporter [Candidatus Omnitrophota bacterium]